MQTTPQNQKTAGRMSLANVTKGKVKKPIRVVIYGVEGAGKSTFGADAPSPIFLCSEDGTAHLDVARFPAPQSWLEVFEALGALLRDEHDFTTLVIDSLDWLEPLCWAHVCAMNGKTSIEDFSYGKGYLAAADQWRMLIDRLDRLVKKGMNVVLIAHSHTKKAEDLVSGAFERYKMKLHDKAAELFREWSDAVLFARYDVKTIDVGTGKFKRSRGQYSGRRVLHTQWSASFDAKNRFGLPEIIDLNWQSFFDLCHDDSQVDSLIENVRHEIARLPTARRAPAEKALSDWAGRDKIRLSKLYEKIVFEVAETEQSTEGSEK